MSVLAWFAVGLASRLAVGHWLDVRRRLANKRWRETDGKDSDAQLHKDLVRLYRTMKPPAQS